jgi:hypothetical protein
MPKKFLNDKSSKKYITIVSGLPRSGTSMMMNMLQSGGMQLMVDNTREPDEDNPKGYFEFEPVKKIKEGDFFWLADSYGKAIKIVSPLLKYLPSDNKYKVIFMRRDIVEIIASQNRMLQRLAKDHDAKEDAKMVTKFERHLQQIEQWLLQQINIEVMNIFYSDVIQNPRHYSDKVNRFLDGKLNVQKMAQAVERSLYRQRKF